MASSLVLFAAGLFIFSMSGQGFVIHVAETSGNQGGTSNLPDSTQIVNMRITVNTSNADSAGTDARVYILIGSRRIDLDTPRRNDFEKGQRDSFMIFPTMTMGELRRSRIILAHDNSGKKPGWNISSFSLDIQGYAEPQVRQYKRWAPVGWLAKDEPPFYSTEVELQAAR
jgi:hypothetical protein